MGACRRLFFFRIALSRLKRNRLFSELALLSDYTVQRFLQSLLRRKRLQRSLLRRFVATVAPCIDPISGQQTDTQTDGRTDEQTAVNKRTISAGKTSLERLHSSSSPLIVIVVQN